VLVVLVVQLLAIKRAMVTIQFLALFHQRQAVQAQAHHQVKELLILVVLAVVAL
jgi:hypothetical protein